MSKKNSKEFAASEFRARPGKSVHLKKWPTRVKPIYDSKENYEAVLANHVGELSKMQSMLYAHNRYALLLIFQAMDAAGKDSAIKHVMSGINPQGCQVFSFKHPSDNELEHDFLWRTTVCLPERGRIGIFNRSYYEEVLVARVHPDIVVNERIPEDGVREDRLWDARYKSIVNFEKHLHQNGTRILKFFLHVSKDEQRERFLRRIDNPDKNWKISPDDIKERRFWKQYMQVYATCIEETTTEQSPWFIVPADDKANAQLIISRAIVDAMKDLKLSYPKLGGERVAELKAMRRELEKS